MGRDMELRHLRYFVAVAEEGSLTNAAERRLHTAQPSLSRQIRDLELEVGVKLLVRGARGIALTAAGRVFLDHARLALLQVQAAGDAARRAAQPERPAFVLGFLTGHEVVWLPDALRILREEVPSIEITLLSSQSSPELAGALMRGKVDVAFLRREAQAPGIAFRFLIKEPLVAVLPTGHRLAARKKVRPQDIAGEAYITPTRVAPVLKSVIDAYAAKVGITLKPQYESENLASSMSLVASTGGVTLLPLYAQNLLSSAVVMRPLQGEPPTIDLVMGYNSSNTSALLKRFLSRADELVARVSNNQGSRLFAAR
jgi:LysR family hca operon transcriptional activator